MRTQIYVSGLIALACLFLSCKSNVSKTEASGYSEQSSAAEKMQVTDGEYESYLECEHCYGAKEKYKKRYCDRLDAKTEKVCQKFLVCKIDENCGMFVHPCGFLYPVNFTFLDQITDKWHEEHEDVDFDCSENPNEGKDAKSVCIKGRCSIKYEQL